MSGMTGGKNALNRCLGDALGTGGAEGIRTPDLLIANETLYQLSYDPVPKTAKRCRFAARVARPGFVAGRSDDPPGGRLPTLRSFQVRKSAPVSTMRRIWSNHQAARSRPQGRRARWRRLVRRLAAAGRSSGSQAVVVAVVFWRSECARFMAGDWGMASDIGCPRIRPKEGASFQESSDSPRITGGRPFDRACSRGGAVPSRWF